MEDVAEDDNALNTANNHAISSVLKYDIVNIQ
jgi:hypothetical protein